MAMKRRRLGCRYIQRLVVAMDCGKYIETQTLAICLAAPYGMAVRGTVFCTTMANVSPSMFQCKTCRQRNDHIRKQPYRDERQLH